MHREPGKHSYTVRGLVLSLQNTARSWISFSSSRIRLSTEMQQTENIYARLAYSGVGIFKVEILVLSCVILLA